MIDEKKLKEDVKEYYSGLKPQYISKLVEAVVEDIIDIIESQPNLSLETKTSDKWIPASEPPKESGAYYVTIDDSFAKELKVYIAVYDGSKWQTWANVIAWMPLPDAYKGE